MLIINSNFWSLKKMENQKKNCKNISLIKRLSIYLFCSLSYFMY
jgi:hypothetical protein